MKVLVDCTPISIGGGIQVAIALIAGLREQTDIVWRAVASSPIEAALPAEILADGRVIRIKKETRFDRIRLRSALIDIEQEFAPDIVFTVFGPAYFRARGPHVVGFALPYLIYERDGLIPAATPSERFVDWLRCVMLRRADHLVVETETVRRRLAGRLRIDPARISVIGNSVNPFLMRKPAADAPAGRFNFLIPSAYYLHKNLEIAPRVAAAMRQLDPDLDFVFQLTLEAGEAPWTAIAEQAQRLGVSDRLVTLGVLPLEDLARAYREASAVFLPTVREASTAVYPESFYFRRPLVTSDMDFARELCGEAAMFVAPHAPQEIACRLIELARSPKMRARLVEAGIQQLARAYPQAKDKFAMQMAMLAALARREGAKADAAGRELAAEPERPSGAAPELKSVQDRPHRRDAIDFHDRIARQWDSKYLTGGFRRRAAFFEREIMPLIARPGDWLDAGCGSGYFSRMLSAAGGNVIGVDASAAMIAAATEIAMEAKLSNPPRFQVVDTVERLSFPDESFSGCVCLSVVEYLDNPYQCLDELARVLAPGGALVVSAPHANSPVRLAQSLATSMMARSKALKWRYRAHSNFETTRRELREVFARRGLTLQKIVGFDAALPPFLRSSLPPSLMFAIAIKAGREDAE